MREGFIGAAAAVLLFTAAVAAVGQPQGVENAEETTSLEERVAALEKAVASLDTRLEARTVGRDDARGMLDDRLLVGRVEQLERALSALRSDLQRIERTADAASRAAENAQRAAASAERAARDAASRIR